MNRDATDPGELYIGLLEGRIPSEETQIEPAAYAAMLIEAIRFHEDQMGEAKDGMVFSKEMLECLDELVENDRKQGKDPCEDDLVYVSQLSDDITFGTEQVLEAKSMKEQCESELLRLLESHPELKGKL